MKICSKCNIRKKNSEFYKNKSSKDGLQGRCKACKYIFDPQYHLKRNYGITEETKFLIAQNQGGVCAICKKYFIARRDIHTDHCHLTNKLRGILCKKCNTGLGSFDDLPERLRFAALYVEYYAEQNKLTPLSTGSHQEGQDDTTHGTIHGAGPREDCDGAHHHIGEPEGQDADSSPQEGGGVSVGAGVPEMGAFETIIYSKGDGDSKTKTDLIREYVEYICSESRELGMAIRAKQEVRLPDHRREQPVQRPKHKKIQSPKKTSEEFQTSFDFDGHSEPTGTARSMEPSRHSRLGGTPGDEPDKV